MKTKHKRRYSGEDKHFGPFTFSKHGGHYRPFGITLDSGGEDDYGDKGCNIKFQAFGYSLIVELPPIVPDFRIKHIADSWDAATVARMGRNYYFEVFPREFGFVFSEDALHVRYGPQTHDSLTTKSKCYFLPWKQWRHVRFSLYGLSGEHFWSQYDRDQGKGISKFEAQHEAEQRVPKIAFRFRDHDGKEITATTHIEEREWRFGDKWCKWLGLFRRPMVKRSLELKFSEEVGPEKGSWKGGTVGHSIEMIPGELHESAFRRYCEQEHRAKYGKFRITYLGKVSEGQA